MKKNLLLFITFLTIFQLAVHSQVINISSVNTSGRFNSCNNGLPTVVATLINGPGSSVDASGALVCNNPCDSSRIKFVISNIRFNQQPNTEWLHGMFFPTNAAYRVQAINVAPFTFFPGCVGTLPCSWGTAGGQGFYYDAISANSCCPGNTPNDGNPANNWGLSTLTCNSPFTLDFEIVMCNTYITSSSTLFRLRGTSDGFTGCWTHPATTESNTIDFAISTVVCPVLFSNPPSATPVETTCSATGTPTYTTILTGGCGSSNTITWWTALNGGSQIGTGSPYTHNIGNICPATNYTVYAQCCPVGSSTCNARVAVFVGTCPPPLTITNVTTVNPLCPSQCGDVTSVTVINAVGALSYTLLPENITNSTGVFTCVTGASHSIKVKDLTTNCTATAGANFVIPPCGGPTTVPISYCQNAIAVPLTATLTPAGAVAGSTLLWYLTSVGGTGSSTPPTPSTAVVGPFTYYVSEINGAIESPRNPLVVTILALPAAPLASSPVTYCLNATAAPLSATGTNLMWYTVLVGGTGSTTAPTPSTATATSTTYYVSQTASGTPACEGPRKAIVVNVLALPAAPSVTTPITYCQNATAIPLSVSAGPGLTTIYYTVATGGTGTSTAPTPNTATAISTTYYVSHATTGTPVCEGPRAAIVVTITATPAAPTVSTPVTYCQFASASVLTATGTNLLWYTVPTAGTASTTAPTPITTSGGSTTYYVSQTTNGTPSCESPRASILVTVTTLPPAPTVTSPILYCLNQATVPLSVTPATGMTTTYYTSAVGGTGTTTAPTPTSSSSGSTNYYVSQTTTGTPACEGPRALLVVTVAPAPAAPTVSNPAPYCQGNPAAILTATGTGVLQWYQNPTGGPVSTTAPTPSTTATGTTTYYVSQLIGTCESPRASITVTVVAVPAIPTITSVAPTCAVAGTSTISNYNVANTYTFTPAGPAVSVGGLVTGITLGTSYTVTSGNVNCTSPSSSAFSNLATLVTPAVPTISYVSATCTADGINTISNYSATNTYTFTPSGPTVSGAGLVSGMVVGTSYTVTASSSTGTPICTSVASVSFSKDAMLVTPAVPAITSVAPTCAAPGTSTISNIVVANATSYTFTPAGPVASNTGLITGMTLGTSYTVTTSNGSCTSAASVAFSNLATLVTPAVPTLTSVAPTCLADGNNTISNYNTLYTYTFSPAGPTASAGGLVTGMVVGNSYTVTAGLGICTSAPSASFSNVMMLVTPAIPTITGVAPTCLVPGTSTISNYNAANIYTFSPTGPTASAGGLVTGMTIGTSYTVTSGNATCTSVASASFSNAATLVTPAVPTLTSVAPTCLADGNNTISNYNTLYTYTFSPAGPIASATGLVTGMVVGNSYTVTAGLGICTSAPSASFSNLMMLVTPTVPTITSVAPTCLVPGISTISNYNAANIYTFSPTGPTASAGGLVTGMTIGTSYTVTSGNATCTSVASASFSNLATLVTPAVPTLTSVAPTCLADGTSTISNYNALYTYTFSPTGPSVSALGLVSGMVVGTSYTVTAGLGICTSVASASFSNLMMLVTPTVPSITGVAPTCLVPGTSTISNYNAANTYTFSPTGPTASAGGLVTGMTIGTNYTVTSGNATCTSVASASFSNLATLVTPAVPTLTSVAPTCAANGISTISNYNAANTYTFSPTGPTASATGLVTGMVVGTGYTVTAGLGICTSVASASFSNLMMLVTPAVPTISGVTPTCLVPGTSTISNYNAANTYTFSPTGPAASVGGLVTGMTIGTSYTVTSGNATCTSVASASFSNLATLVTPAVPSLTSVAPTCLANGTSTISNYNAANTYTFSPSGPTASATGLVIGMVVGTSYTVTAGLGICTSVASASFTNLMMLVTPAVPTITSVAPTCLVPGTSTISNYNAANTYTFSPTGPAVSAGGLVTGMTIGTSYTVTSGNATCTSVASASFSNLATLVTPAVPSLTSVAPTCLANGTSTISNYNALYTYTFSPAGPTASVGGLVTGMVVGNTYTLTAGLGICTSVASASFTNLMMLVTPAVPTITGVPSTCLVPGTSTISNYNAANTYTFSPTGPAVSAGGLVTGMTIGTSYSVTSGNATCTSVASASFSNLATLVTPAVPSLTSVAPTCLANGTSTISNYNAANTYTFSPSGPTASATGLVIGMVVGTSYTVTAGSSTGTPICTSAFSAQFSNQVKLITPGAPSVSNPFPYCQNATTLPLTATGTNLLWYANSTGGTGSTIAPTPSSSTAGTTTYYVSQTLGICEGPRAAITVTITATPTAPIVITPITYCPNDPAIPLTATGTNLLWYNLAAGGTGNTTAPTPITSSPGSFNFYVSQSTSATSGSCEGPRARIVVNVNNNNLTVNIGSDTTICEGESVKFTPIVNPTPTNIIYKWRAQLVPASTIDNVNIKDATVAPVDNAIYILNAKINGCATEDTVKVFVRLKPIVDAGLNKAICLKDSALLTGVVTHNTTAVNTFAWTPTDSLRNANLISTYAYPTKTTWYKLTATTTKAVYGCDFSVSDSVKIIVQSISAPFAGNDTIAVKGLPHQLHGSGGLNYSWTSPTPNVTFNNPFIQNAKVTLYNDANVYLRITDNIGCEGKDSLFIKVYEGPTYYVPNSFTPNGDGLNDIFRPIPVGIANTTYFRVFNRFGQLMFETNQWLKGWDGTFKGKPAANGTYVWMVAGTDKDFKKVDMKGSVILIR